MAPKGKNKGKEKVEADLIPDLIPLKILNKYKIGGQAFKILKESQQWNDVIISKNPKHVLRGISGLEDIMIDKICQGLNKYMDSLESEASVFTQDTLSTLDKVWDVTDKKDMPQDRLVEMAWLKYVILEAKDYARQFYTREEVIQKLSAKFRQEEVTKNMYDLWFTSKSKKAKNAYLLMSSIRASQRKVEENELEMVSHLKEEFENLIAEQNELVGEEEKNHKDAALSQQVSDEKELVKKNELEKKSEEAEKLKLQQLNQEKHASTEQKEKHAAAEQKEKMAALSQQVSTLTDVSKNDNNA